MVSLRVVLLGVGVVPVCLGLVPVSVKEVANGIRDGLQKGLNGRNSRLSVELPPGAPLALQGDKSDNDFSWFKRETETAQVVKGDRALADLAALLFPEDMTVGAVYASPDAAKAAVASRAAKGCERLTFEGSPYLSRVLQVPILGFHELILSWDPLGDHLFSRSRAATTFSDTYDR